MKNECEKKKAKSTVTWHKIECDGSVKKNQFECAGVQPFQVREEQKDLLFWSTAKSRCPMNCRGQPNWLKWRRRWLNAMTCNKIGRFSYAFWYATCNIPYDFKHCRLIPTNQHESFQSVLSSLARLPKNFSVGHPSKNYSKSTTYL